VAAPQLRPVRRGPSSVRRRHDGPRHRAHLGELYGVDIGRDTISRVTDAILDDVAAWRARPLNPVYPIVYFDAMFVKVREDRSVKSRACYLAVGVTCDGEREVLGVWWQETEGAKFWLAVLNDLRRRGVENVLISCVDGLKGFPEAIEATFPAAWVQTCIVHLIRASLRYVNYRDRKKVASALRPIYTAPNAETALVELERFDAEWGERYPATVNAWRGSCEHVVPFLALPDELRRAVYTTNTIEGLHRQIRKAIKTRGHFPDEQAATKLIYLAIQRADAKWSRHRSWTAPRAALKSTSETDSQADHHMSPRPHTQFVGQSRVDLVLHARAGPHELDAARQAPAHHADALIRRPHAVELARPQQLASVRASTRSVFARA
jgi:putative transposase